MRFSKAVLRGALWGAALSIATFSGAVDFEVSFPSEVEAETVETNVSTTQRKAILFVLGEPGDGTGGGGGGSSGSEFSFDRVAQLTVEGLRFGVILALAALGVTAGEVQQRLAQCEDLGSWSSEQAHAWWREHGEVCRGPTEAEPSEGVTRSTIAIDLIRRN